LVLTKSKRQECLAPFRGEFRASRLSTQRDTSHKSKREAKFF
jgi:hypothetical protein